MRTLSLKFLLCAGLVHVGTLAAAPALPAAATPFDAPAPLLTQPQAAWAIDLPGARRIRFATTIETPAPGLVGVRGRSPAGERLSLFRTDAGLSGEVYASGGHFRLARFGSDYAWLPAGAAGVPQPQAGWEEPRGIPLDLPQPGVAAPKAALQDDGQYEIDLAVVYTPLYEARLGGRDGARQEIERLVFVANGYFQTSGIPVRYRLVGAEKYTGTSESATLRRNLGVTTRDPAVRAWRDKIGADLVIHLRTAEGCSGLVGLSQGFNHFEQSDPPENVVPDRDGFAAAAMGPGADGTQCPDWVFAHELGHNLAGGHHWVQHQSNNIYWKPYSHGWQCGVAGADGLYSSIMSYLPTGIEGRGDFFSTPELMLDGMPCGTTGSPLEPTHADNARAIREAAPYVAAYRPRR